MLDLIKNQKQKVTVIISFFSCNKLKKFRARKAIYLLKRNVKLKIRKKVMERMMFKYYASKVRRYFQSQTSHYQVKTLTQLEIVLYLQIYHAITIQRWYRKWKFGKWLNNNCLCNPQQGNTVTILNKNTHNCHII